MLKIEEIIVHVPQIGGGAVCINMNTFLLFYDQQHATQSCRYSHELVIAIVMIARNKNNLKIKKCIGVTLVI